MRPPPLTPTPSAGPLAPWTGMIKFTEEDPTGMELLNLRFYWPIISITM